MSPNPFERSSKMETKSAEHNPNDKALLRDAENKIRTLNDFLITGNLASDYNYFLAITSRNINYKKATNESQEELLKNLENILSALIEGQDERINDINVSDAAKMFYKELPRAEIAAITKLIESYK